MEAAPDSVPVAGAGEAVDGRVASLKRDASLETSFDLLLTRDFQPDATPVVADIRDALNGDQLALLGQFRARLVEAAATAEARPEWRDFVDFNAKSAKKKRSAGEPPAARLWLRDLTDKQQAWLTDRCLCRYLRAREWDLLKAEHMIRCTLAWREDYKPEQITAAEIEDQARTGKMYFYPNHRSKAGFPIVYMKLNRDQGQDRETKLKFLVWTLEKVIGEMDEARGIEKMAWLADFKGTGVRMAGMSHINLSLDCLHTLQNHYPERLGLAFVVNPPRVFSAFFKILTPFMSEVTLNKIKFIANSKDYPVFLSQVDASNLERTFGGDYVGDYNHDDFVAREIKSEAPRRNTVM